MSAGLGRRSGHALIAGAHVRQIPWDAHEGSRTEQLRRYEQAAGNAARGDVASRNDFAARMFPWLIDTRNLMLAIDHIRREGPKAPGPNGIRTEELSGSECIQAARVLAEALKIDRYRLGPTRQVRIPKVSGEGHRTLQLLNAEDKIVHRALLQAISPFVDPQFYDRSYGFRPQIGREDALLELERLVHEGSFPMAISEDMANAFDNVPVRRMLDVLPQYDLPPEIVRAVARSVGNRRRGIPQGSPLAPLLLNAYVGYGLDRRWPGTEAGVLFRSADDILILCFTAEQASRDYSRLARLVGDLGMRLKGNPPTAVRRTKQGFDWLGFHLTVAGNRLTVSISDRSWKRLGAHLSECAIQPNPDLRAWECTLAWASQLGPCLEHVHVVRTYERVVDTAKSRGFSELPDQTLFLTHWERAHARYLALRGLRHLLDLAPASGVGSAQRHHLNRSLPEDGSPHVGLPSPAATLSVFDCTIFTDGSALAPRGRGGWAYLIESSDGRRIAQRSGAVDQTTNNRMELQAVIESLQDRSASGRIALHTDSAYVVEGVKLLPRRRGSRWRRDGGGLIVNCDLWQQLSQLLDHLDVQFVWVRSHSGNPRNELCDIMARNAASTT